MCKSWRYESPEYPVPKSSSAITKPFSWRTLSVCTRCSSTCSRSVTSITRFRSFLLKLSLYFRHSATNDGEEIWEALKFIPTWKPSGSLLAIAFIFAATCLINPWVSGIISPDFSATGIKEAGEIYPAVGCFHLASTSTPRSVPSLPFTTGW